MTKKWPLVVIIGFSFSTTAWSAPSACSETNAACSDQPVSPPSLEPMPPTPQAPDSNTAALAPMQPPEQSDPINSGSQNQQAINLSRDKDLFADPSKAAAVTDPFGPDANQHIRVSPQNQ